MTFEIYGWWIGESCADYTGATEADDRKIVWEDAILGDPLPEVEAWKPPRLTQYRGGNGRRALRPVLDCQGSVGGNIISDRARLALHDILSRHARLYPVWLDDRPDERYFMVVPETTLECLDRERSTGPLQKYGPTPDYFADVHHWVFDEACVGDVDLFRIPDSASTVYVSERFRQCVADSGLQGFCLRRQAFDDNPWTS